MNRTMYLFFAVAVIGMTLFSCKSKQLVTEIEGAETPATAEVVDESPASPAPAPVSAQPEVTRSESFKLAAGETNGAALNNKYHVVVGAFGNHDNARNLRAKLISEGNNALMVQNESGMLRVIIASFNEYSAAHAKIDQIRSVYPDAWVLIQKK